MSSTLIMTEQQYKVLELAILSAIPHAIHHEGAEEYMRRLYAANAVLDEIMDLSDEMDELTATMEPVDPDVHTRRAVDEAVDWDRAFNRDPLS